MTKIYLASSGKNPEIKRTMEAVHAAGYTVLDWTAASNPAEWAEWFEKTADHTKWTPEQHEQFILRDRQVRQIAHRDYTELFTAEAGVIVLPAGRSAHLEIGFLLGAGRPTCAYYAAPGIEPEPMLRGVSAHVHDLQSLMFWLSGVAPMTVTA